MKKKIPSSGELTVTSYPLQICERNVQATAETKRDRLGSKGLSQQTKEAGEETCVWHGESFPMAGEARRTREKYHQNDPELRENINRWGVSNANRYRTTMSLNTFRIQENRNDGNKLLKAPGVGKDCNLWGMENKKSNRQYFKKFGRKSSEKGETGGKG